MNNFLMKPVKNINDLQKKYFYIKWKDKKYGLGNRTLDIVLEVEAALLLLREPQVVNIIML